MQMKDKRFMVTGGSAGIGLAIARMLIEMITQARHWEQMEEARERCGLDPEPAPFHWTVMGHLERVNKQRRAAQRQQMEKQLEYRAQQAKIARRRDSMRPNISRRVENERRVTNRARAESGAGSASTGE